MHLECWQIDWGFLCACVCACSGYEPAWLPLTNSYTFFFYFQTTDNDSGDIASGVVSAFQPLQPFLHMLRCDCIPLHCQITAESQIHNLKKTCNAGKRGKTNFSLFSLTFHDALQPYAASINLSESLWDMSGLQRCTHAYVNYNYIQIPSWII